MRDEAECKAEFRVEKKKKRSPQACRSLANSRNIKMLPRNRNNSREILACNDNSNDNNFISVFPRRVSTWYYLCLVPRRLSRYARKGRREGDNRLRLPSVPFPWSLAVYHQSLVSRSPLLTRYRQVIKYFVRGLRFVRIQQNPTPL